MTRQKGNASMSLSGLVARSLASEVKESPELKPGPWACWLCDLHVA